MSKRSFRWPAMVAVAAVSVTALCVGIPAPRAQLPAGGTEVDGQFASLKTLQPPIPDLAGVVVDKKWAMVLGKALFWDQRVGSDGQACASCHFHSGADPRNTDQLSPGIKATPVDTSFQSTASGGKGGPNYTMTGKDFPFHRLTDPTNRDSAVTYDTNDIMGSAGTNAGNFTSVGNGTESCTQRPLDSFSIAGTGANAGKTLLTRHVEPRNTPSVINAVFNIRNFWDGRANNVFNGVDPFGLRDADARLLVADSSGVSLQPFAIGGASLASQAVGPALSDFEMSCSNRTFADLGKKLENAVALSGQAIDANDSMFGAPGPFGDLRAGSPPGSSSGLNTKYTYAALVKKAFAPRYWQDTNKWRVVNGQLVKDTTGYTQLETNFSMFWGVAIMLYESTLVSDDSPFDRYMDSGMNPVPGFGDAEIRGMEVFGNEGNCIHCHNGPVFSSAAIGVNFVVENNVVERMTMADGGIALYDNGFYNIGVRPTRDDPGVGGTDPFGYSLSFTRQYVANPYFPVPDNFSIDACQFINPFPNCTVLPSDFGPLTQRVAVDGSFKVPSLRNVALTPPYFHNGGQGTLAQVVQFYNRGGDARTLAGGAGDTSGTGVIGEDDLSTPPAGSNLHPLMFNRGLTAQQQSDLVAFLKALTDDRVRCHKAPFDHPGLAIPTSVNTAGTPTGSQAAEYKMALAATGKDGLPATKCSLIRNDGDIDQLPSTLTGLMK